MNYGTLPGFRQSRQGSNGINSIFYNSGEHFFMPEFHCRFSGLKPNFVKEWMKKKTVLSINSWIVEEKYWQKLLREWRSHGRAGFSIPYIIGSQQYLPANHSSQDIEELITDIIETGDETILLRYCSISAIWFWKSVVKPPKIKPVISHHSRDCRNQFLEFPILWMTLAVQQKN